MKREARTPERQQAAIDALTFKCDMLWAMLDALYFAYVAPGLTPPGAFVPGAAPMSAIADTARPRLPAGVRLSHDRTRDRWVLLAPERILELDEVAKASCRCATASATSAGDRRSNWRRSISADRSEIMTDVKEMLGDLAAKHFVVL